MCLGDVTGTLTNILDPGHFILKSPDTAAPAVPAVAAPIAPPQAAKAPDVNGIQNAATTPGGGINSGPASTLLTGTTGVDTSSLNLGKGGLLGSNTLLGS